MDFSMISDQFIAAMWKVAPIPIGLAILLAVFKSTWFKGIIGEFLINLTTKLFLDKRIYHLIKDVTLPTEDGSTQIDHVVVSKFGIFVVETKNMKGWIFGSPGQKKWTQKIYRHSNQFQNPLHQNHKHTKTLESLLELNENQIYSVIVFVGGSTFKTEMPENVVRIRAYASYIKSKKTPILTESQVADITRMIEQGRLAQTFKTKREHVRHVKDIVAEKDKSNPPICPECDGEMVLRKTRKGNKVGQKFWGCQRFPQCKGKIAIR